MFSGLSGEAGDGISGMVHTRLIIDQYLLGENEQVPATTYPVHQSDQKMFSQSMPTTLDSRHSSPHIRCFFKGVFLYYGWDISRGHSAENANNNRLQDRDQRPQLCRPAYLCTDTNEEILSYMKGSTEQGMKRFGYCVNHFAFTLVQGKN
jgi:hypothetical protein